MEKYYRVEFTYPNGQVIEWGTFYTTVEEIIKAYSNSIKNHPVINVYTKYGKKAVASFQG